MTDFETINRIGVAEANCKRFHRAIVEVTESLKKQGVFDDYEHPMYRSCIPLVIARFWEEGPDSLVLWMGRELGEKLETK